jgi:hypothetical protein
MAFYQVFLLSPLQCTVTNCRNLCEFEEIEISRQREVTVNSKEDFCLVFVLEFELLEFVEQLNRCHTKRPSTEHRFSLYNCMLKENKSDYDTYRFHV